MKEIWIAIVGLTIAVLIIISILASTAHRPHGCCTERGESVLIYDGKYHEVPTPGSLALMLAGLAAYKLTRS